MATVNRDYGALQGASLPSNNFNVTQRRQVYQSTHMGEDRLPHMNRSFISFTYGGKHIEDFNLIATTTGNRMQSSGYTSFSDSTTTYDALDGQQYWGTHYKSNSLSVQLATDGIDQKDLDEFLHWFQAGVSRELILAEHPNRAQFARVSEPPALHLLPFEQEVDVMISGYSYKTKTTLYKGEIDLKFVMDEPHWYAKDNVLGTKVGNRYINEWEDANGNSVSIFASQDALKILYEDGIPLGSMIEKNMLLGNGLYASVESNDASKIWSIAESEIVWTNGEPSGVGARVEDEDDLANPPIGIIAGPILDVGGNGISTLAADAEGYFFYAGTAPAPTIITFTLTPTFNNYYIDSPRNSFVHNENPYNKFIIKSVNEQVLKFTTPNIYTSYNQVIRIIDDMFNSTQSWEAIRTYIRETVHHQAVREWANKVLDRLQGSNSNTAVVNQTNDNGLKNTAKSYMQKMFFTLNGSATAPITLTFNSKTGDAIATLGYRSITSSAPSGDMSNYGTFNNSIEEDVGDMLRSNYIILKDRNYPTANGVVTTWTESSPTNSHMLTHDVVGGLSNIQITYQNMYL